MSAIAFDAAPPSALRVMPGVIMLALALGVSGYFVQRAHGTN
jgi:hypothetical protein